MPINEKEFIRLGLEEGLTEDFIFNRLQEERNKFVPTDAPIKGDTLSLELPSQSITVDALPVVEDLTPELKKDFELYGLLALENKPSPERAEKLTANVISGLKDFERTTENIALVFPVIETIGEVITGTLASGLAGIAGLANLHSVETIFNPIRKLEESQALMTEIQSLLTFEAPSERGKELSQAAQFPFIKLEEFADNTGDIVLDSLTGTALDANKEELASAVATAIKFSPFLIPALNKVKPKPKVIPEPVKVSVRDFPKPERTPKKTVTLKPKQVKITKDLKVKPKSRQKPVIVPEEGKIGKAGFENVRKEQVGRLKELNRQDEILLKTQKELKEKRKTAMKFKDEVKAKEITKDLADIAKNRKQIATDIAKTKRVSTKQKIEVKPEPKKEVKVDRKLEEAKRKEKAKVEKDARRKHNKAVTSVEKQFDKPFSDMDFSELDNIDTKQSRQVDNSKVTVARLHEIAKEAGIKGQSKMKKQQLIDSIVEESKKPEAIDSPVENNLELTSKEPPKTVNEFDTPKPKKGSEAETVHNMYERGDLAKKQSKTRSFKAFTKAFSRMFVDVSGGVKRKLLTEFGEQGKWASLAHDQILGSSNKAKLLAEDVAKKVYDGLNGNQLKMLDRYITSRRIIDIDKTSAYLVKKGDKIVERFPTLEEANNFAKGKNLTVERFKHPEGISGETHAQAIADINPELRAILEERAQIYFKEMNRNLKEMFDEGLISAETFETLKNSDYAKRSFINKLDPDVNFNFGDGKVTVTSSGIKKLKSGSEGYLETNTKLLMEDVIGRTQAQIAKNRANGAMLKLAKEIPDNGVVKVLKGDKAPNGWTKIDVFEKGQQQSMIMPNEFAKEWIIREPLIDAQLSNAISWVSGSKVLKASATGLNPEFAITNFPRDVAHIYLTTDQFSSFLPKAAVQFTKDVLTVSKDAITRKGRYRDYILEGGGMEFLTNQGEFGGKFHNFGKYLSYLGETSEALTRLALRERGLKNGLSSVEATMVARNYMDFSKGGSVAKVIDSAFPYFNASIQATRGIFRAARDNTGAFIFKSGQIGGLATGLYMANKFMNPEAWAEIPDEVKVNNWVVTTPLTFTDAQGNKRYHYISIPKDQGQRIMATAFEAPLAKKFEGKDPTEASLRAMQDFFPLMPVTNLPPTAAAIFGYMSNFDFWRRKDIWGGAEVKPEKEFFPSTHPFFVKSGDLSGMSPEKLKFATSQFFTRGNIYTSMVDIGYNAIFEDLTPSERDKVSGEILKNIPFSRRILKTTFPSKGRKEAKEAKVEENTRRRGQNIKLEGMVNEMFDGKKTRQNVIEWIRSNEKVADRQRLADRFRREEKLEGIPNRGWWIDLTNLPPETRAGQFFVQWEKSTTEQRKELERTAGKVPGINSGNFATYFKALKNK
jgi:hypothetical protein